MIYNSFCPVFVLPDGYHLLIAKTAALFKIIGFQLFSFAFALQIRDWLRKYQKMFFLRQNNIENGQRIKENALQAKTAGGRLNWTRQQMAVSYSIIFHLPLRLQV